MLPQYGRAQNTQNTGAPPFPQSTEPLFNLDTNAAAKQMAALNVANMQRQLTNAYPRPPAPSPSQIPLGGATPGSFLGGIPSPYNQSNMLQPAILDAPATMQFPPHASLQVQPAFPPAHSLQHNQASVEPSIPSTNVQPRHPPNVTTFKHKQRSFLVTLAQVHLSKGTPLPPALTAVPYPPNYDPASSQWKGLECSSEVGAFRLAGKDVDLFKFWGIVSQLGGGQKVTQQNAWSQLLPQFELPEYLPVPLSNGQRTTAAVLAHYYTAIIQPFEEMYRRNIQDANRKAAMTTGRPQGGSVVPSNPPNMPLQAPNSASSSSHLPGPVHNMMGLLNQSVSGGQNTSAPITGSPTAAGSQTLPQSPHPPHGLSGTHGFSDSLAGHSLAPPPSSTAIGPLPVPAGNENHEQDAPGTKRRFESEELDGKRAKLKLGGAELPDVLPSMSASADHSLPQNPATSAVPCASSRPRSQFARTKIEYIPLAREVDTYGGRDLNMLEDGYTRAQRRPMRDINEWGTVDIEALTMSIRCRLTVELSYALTTLTLLSTMKGPTPGSGFPIAQCTDLLEEVLDLLEDEAFGGVADTPQYCLADDTPISRHRELVTHALETELLPFAGLKSEQHSRETDHGPRHRSSQVILAVTNIIRNLSVVPDNMQFMARHDRTLELLLRVCGVVVPQEGGPSRPISPALSIPDVISVRKDVLNILCNLSIMIAFPQSTSLSESTTRICTRIFELIASILIEPVEAIPPTQMLKLSGIPFHNCKPPTLSDMALDVFTHIAHLDHNRKVISMVIPQQWLWRLLETLVYRLPVSDPDFAFLSRESWLSYLEKATMAIYAIAFLSPPELKKRIKSDRPLHFSQIMLRMAQRLATTNASPEARQWFLSTARRAIEAMKAVDDGEDAFDTTQTTQPTLAFGMGFGESGETSVEKGMGMLASRRDAAWELLMQRDMDPTMFAELESLMRIE